MGAFLGAPRSSRLILTSVRVSNPDTSPGRVCPELGRGPVIFTDHGFTCSLFTLPFLSQSRWTDLCFCSVPRVLGDVFAFMPWRRGWQPPRPLALALRLRLCGAAARNRLSTKAGRTYFKRVSCTLSKPLILTLACGTTEICSCKMRASRWNLPLAVSWPT